MKAYLPYSYLVEHIPKRRVRSVLGFGADTVEVDIPEISSSETSLAVSLEYLLARPSETIVIPAEFRTWDGSILSKIRDEQFDDFPTSWLPRSPGERSGNPPSLRTVYGLDRFDSRGDRIEKYARGDLSGAAEFYGLEAVGNRLVSTTHDDDHRCVKGIADSLVSIDGSLWRRTANVGLYLDTRDFGNRAPWASVGQRRYGYLPHSRLSVAERRYFPCWRRGFDFSQAERLVSHAGERGVEWACRALVIHDDGALAYDGEKEFLLNAMDYVVLSTEDRIGEMSTSAISAWIAARSAVERVMADNASDFTDGEIEAFRSLCGSCDWEEAAMIHKAMSACEEYMNDPWGRFSRPGEQTLGSDFEF